MINSRKLHFALVVQTITSVNLTEIKECLIKGYCGDNRMGELAAFVIHRGYQIEFSRSGSNQLTSEFTIYI